MITRRVVSGIKNGADVVAELGTTWDVYFCNQARTILGLNPLEISVARRF
jgi:hypothetical protein